MRVDVLGSLRILSDDGTPVELSDPRMACVLIVLAVNAGRPVPVEALVRATYGSDSLCGLESSWLGRHLTELSTTLGTTPKGDPYLTADPLAARHVLTVDGQDVDAVQFASGVDDLLHQGVDLSHDERLARERALLDLWRADPVIEHRRLCRTTDRLFRRHRRLYRQLGELAVHDLAAAGRVDEAEDVLDAVLDLYSGDQELLVLRERLLGGHPTLADNTTGHSADVPTAAAGAASFPLLEAQADLAVFGLATAWQATSRSPVADGLRAVLEELEAMPHPDQADIGDLVRLVAERPSGSISATALIQTLWPEMDGEAARRLLHGDVRRANARLGHLPSNQLHEFSLNLRAADGSDGDEVVSISPVDVATLLARSPRAAGVMEPNLRLAWTLYDAGTYSQALRAFAQVAKSVADGRMLTRTELTLFFYYFAKCLLKLNMYIPLQQLVEGPYRELALTTAELDAERLQIAGTLHRHLGDLTESQRCLDEAVSLLETAVDGGGPPVLWRALCDAEVLRCHPRLDHAVSSGPSLDRRASVRFVKEALRRARRHMEQFCQETGETTHYEGRLSGTWAFATIADSIVNPDDIDDAAWGTALDQARAGFEPEQARKPVGIVAGRAALAAVHLARATWAHRTQSDAGEQIRGDLDAAEETLGVAMRHHLPTVELGSRFEHRKLLALKETIQAVRRDPDADVSSDALSPLV